MNERRAVRPFRGDPTVSALFPDGGTSLPELDVAYLRRSDRSAWIGTLRVIGVLTALVAAAPHLLGALGWLSIPVLAAAIGAQFHNLTILLHDCSHGTFFRSKRLNEAVGIVAAALAGTGFRAFQTAHMAHHRLHGTAEDVEAADYYTMPSASRGRLIWHLVKPLFFVSAIETLAPGLLGRRTGSARPRPGSPRRWSFREGRGAIVLIAVAQAFMAALASGSGAEPYLIPLYQASAMSFGLFFSRLRGFCEHVPAAGPHAESHIRSHRPHPLERYVLYDLGMNYHVEHHLYPGVPGYHLHAVHSRLADLHHSGTCARSMIGTVVSRLREAARR